MKRRDFFKSAGIFGCGFTFGLGAGNLSKMKNQDNDSNFEQKSDWLPHIEISLCYHCNLNCAGCYHCAPIAPIYFMPLDIFEKDLEQMYKITKGKIRNIMLLGGEPLLNKKIEKYIKITRKYFQDSQLIVFTNGILLNDMSENFWKTCNKYKAIVRHSFYPLYDKYPDLSYSYKQAMKFDVKIQSIEPRYRFTSMKINAKKTNDYIKVYNKCGNKFKCAVIDNGILYPCQVIPSVKLFLNSHFKNLAINIKEDDYLDIYKVKSMDDLLNYFKEPKDFCKYCNYKDEDSKKLWTLSKREAAEWFDV